MADLKQITGYFFKFSADRIEKNKQKKFFCRKNIIHLTP